MAKLLDEVDIVSFIQAALPGKSLVVAYFTRDREYSYYSFENIDILINFLKEREAGDFYINHKKPYVIDFSIDEWLVFSDKEKAAEVFAQIKTVWKNDEEN